MRAFHHLPCVVVVLLISLASLHLAAAFEDCETVARWLPVTTAVVFYPNVEEDGCSGEALLSYDYKDFMGKPIQLTVDARAVVNPEARCLFWTQDSSVLLDSKHLFHDFSMSRQPEVSLVCSSTELTLYRPTACDAVSDLEGGFFIQTSDPEECRPDEPFKLGACSFFSELETAFVLVPRDWQCDIRVGETWTKLNVGLYPFEQDFADSSVTVVCAAGGKKPKRGACEVVGDRFRRAADEGKGSKRKGKKRQRRIKPENRRYWRQQPFEADRLHRAANFGARIMVYLHNSHVAIRLGLVFFTWIVAAFVGWAYYRATTFRYWGWRPWTVTTNITATVPNMWPDYEKPSHLKNHRRQVAERIARYCPGVAPE